MSASIFAESRAFFTLFLRSEWASCHVKTASLEIFVARKPVANPMAEADERAASSTPPSQLDSPSTTTLRAPHVGTVIKLAPVGSRVATGAAYGAIQVLDTLVELLSDCDGIVAEHFSLHDDLVEYEQPLVGLR